MGIDILGVSGSPIKNSNTDRAVQRILKAANLNSEFIKLSELNVKPCLACKRCVNDNICKQPDDFPELAKKVLEAKVLVIGAYCPYGMVDGFTKAFLERLWSMRHVNNLNRGKPVVLVVTGLTPEDSRLRGIVKILFKPLLNKHLALHQVSRSIAREMRMEKMNLLGIVKIPGNVPCLVCGNGNICEMSGAKLLYKKGIVFSKKLCVAIENRPKVLKEIEHMGHKISVAIKQK
ncbi:MAG: flavodoxin family protein [Promethearchaeota archaeon]